MVRQFLYAKRYPLGQRRKPPQRTVSPRRRKDVQYKRLGSPQATWTSQGNAHRWGIINCHLSQIIPQLCNAENLSGYWSRRIDETNRLVYRVTDEYIKIISCRYHY